MSTSLAWKKKQVLKKRYKYLQDTARENWLL